MEYIYLIQSGEDIKIGKTMNVNDRLSSLQTSTANSLKILHYFSTNNANLDETNLHKIFKNKRVTGEWYKLAQEDIFYIKEYFKKSSQRIKLPEREYKRFKNLKNLDNLDESAIFAIYIKNLVRKDSKKYCLDESEKYYVLSKTNFYVNNYDIYSDTHLDALKDILFSEINKERMKKKLTEIARLGKITTDKIENTLIKNITLMDSRIASLKRELR